MNNSPIGVFDSGVGGLTCVKELIKLLPNENVIYLGDTARVPYGTRSQETITQYSKQDIAFLEKHNVKYNYKLPTQCKLGLIKNFVPHFFNTKFRYSEIN